MLQLDPESLTVGVRIPTSEPTGNTTVFPEVGIGAFYRDGTDFRVKVRTGASTYQTASLGTLS